MSTAKKIAIGIIVVLQVLSGLVYYSYQRLEVRFSGASLGSPPVTISREKLLPAVLTFMATGNVLSFINAVDSINIKN